MNRKIGLYFCVAAMLLAVNAVWGEAFTVTPVAWTNDAAGNNDAYVHQRWAVVSNWNDASGSIPLVAPTNAAEHYVVYMTNDMDKSTPIKYINTGSIDGADSNVYLKEGNGVDPSLYAITGSVRYAIKHTCESSYKHQKIRRFTITDPTGFLGWWSVGDSLAYFTLNAAADSGLEPTLQGVDSLRHPFVEVTDAGTKGHVGAITSKGTLEKVGSGALQVDAVLDTGANYIATGGTLEFAGLDESAFDELLSTAALHLDASVPSSYTHTTFADVAGCETLDFIDTWYDVRGTDKPYAQKTNNNGSGPGSDFYRPKVLSAFVSTITSPTGLPLIDFGSHYKDNSAYGPSNCIMTLSTTITGIREAFYVSAYPSGAIRAPVLGGTWSHNDMIDYVPNGTRIACAWDAQPPGMYLGEIFHNCVAKTYTEVNGALMQPLNAVSIASLAGGRMGMLGSDRGYTSRSGGCRVGEILLFTNVLTRAERTRINRYLVNKWLTGKDNVQVGVGLVAKSGTKVSVSGNAKAAVSLVRADNGATFVKAGAGELYVDAITPTNVAISVESGAVIFTNHFAALTTTAPAADPALWLDARKESSFTFVQDENAPEVKYITQWHDCRETGTRYAENIVTTGFPRVPTRVTDSIVGESVVSLGTLTTTYTNISGMVFKDPANKNYQNDYASYVGFMVVRPLAKNGSGRNIFGCCNLTLMRSGATVLLSNTYRNSRAGAALWSVNGSPRDPWNAKSTPELDDVDHYFVIAFRSPEKVNFNGIATDRFYTNNCGFWNVAEVISYDRELSEEEFLQTEAYLMKRWLNKDHPVIGAQQVARMTLPSATDTTVDTARDLTIVKMAGGNGALVKQGAGTLTAQDTSGMNDIRTVRVEGGALNQTTMKDVTEDALFHLDANDSADAFTAYTSKDPDSDDENATVTYVTKWADTRRNGTTANTLMMYSNVNKYRGVAYTNPVLRTVIPVEGAPAKKAMDFGQGRNCYATSYPDANKVRHGSAAEPLQAFHDEASMYFPSAFTTVREFVAVVAAHTNVVTTLPKETISGWDSVGYVRGTGMIVGDFSTYNFTRSWNSTALFSMVLAGGLPKCTMMYSKNYDDTIISIDGTRCAYDTSLENGRFHVITAATSNECAGTIGTLCLDRDCNGGGMLIGEIMAFDRRLTSAERAYLIMRLQNKWFAGPEAHTNTLDSLYVAAGSSYTSDATAIETASLQGGGTVSADILLPAAANLAFGWRTASDYDSMALTGKLVLKEGATVTITAADPRAVQEGEYVLLTAAGGFSGVEVSKLTLVTNFCKGVVPSLIVRKNTLILRVIPRGLVLFIR